MPRPADPRAAGSGGFGYDPLFLIPEYHRTFGELSPLVKHQLSHRARAFARLRPAIDRMIARGEIDALGRARDRPKTRNAPGILRSGGVSRSGSAGRRRCVEPGRTGAASHGLSGSWPVRTRPRSGTTGRPPARSGRPPGPCTQTSTGTCLQIVLGTQTGFISVTCRGHGHRAHGSSASRRPGGRSCTGPCGRTGPSASRRPSAGTIFTHGSVTISQTVWQTRLTQGSATIRQVVTGTCFDAGLGDHPAGGHGHLLDAGLGHHPAGGDRHALDAGLGDHAGDRAGHLLVLRTRGSCG